MLQKLVITSIFLFVINQTLISQDIGFGIKGGITTSYFSIESNVNTSVIDFQFNSNIGFNAGAFIDIFNKGNFVVSSELYFNRKAGNAEIGNAFINLFPGGGVDFQIDYLEYGAPLKFNFKNSNFMPYLFLEPRVNFYLGSDMSRSSDSIPQSAKNIITENLKKFGFGITAGLGSELKIKNGLSLLFEVQFSPDLFDTYASSDFKIRSNTLEFRTGLRFY